MVSHISINRAQTIGMCGSSEADIQTAGFDLLTIRSETEPYLIETMSSASDIDSVKNYQI